MPGEVFPGALSGAAGFWFFSLASSLGLVRFGSERSRKHSFVRDSEGPEFYKDVKGVKSGGFGDLDPLKKRA